MIICLLNIYVRSSKPLCDLLVEVGTLRVIIVTVSSL